MKRGLGALPLSYFTSGQAAPQASALPSEALFPQACLLGTKCPHLPARGPCPLSFIPRAAFLHLTQRTGTSGQDVPVKGFSPCGVKVSEAQRREGAGPRSASCSVTGFGPGSRSPDSCLALVMECRSFASMKPGGRATLLNQVRPVCSARPPPLGNRAPQVESRGCRELSASLGPR